MKILIVSTYFPPQNSIASLRSYSWAKWWSRMGHDVTVLTTKKYPRGYDMHMDTSSFNIIEVGVPVMDFLLERKTRQLEVAKQLNTTPNLSQNESKKENAIKLLFKKIMQKTGVLNGVRFPDFHDLWARNALKKVSGDKWDLVVSTGWPYSAHRIGLALKKKQKQVKWVVDWRDLWTDNHMYPGVIGLRLYEKWLEKRFHKHADLLTTVSKPLENILSAKTATRVEVVFNGFDAEDYVSLNKDPFFKDDSVKRIVYTGSIYKETRDPGPLFSAIKNISKKISFEQLRIVFAGANVEQVKELAIKYDVLKYCEFAGFLPRNDALRMQRDADALLFLEYEAPGVEGILTGKLFEYLFAGPEIIAVGVTETTSAGKLILEAQKGEVFGVNVKSLEVKLLDLVVNGTKKTKQTSEAIKIVKQFEREEQARKMLDLICQLG